MYTAICLVLKYTMVEISLNLMDTDVWLKLPNLTRQFISGSISNDHNLSSLSTPKVGRTSVLQRSKFCAIWISCLPIPNNDFSRVL